MPCLISFYKPAQVVRLRNELMPLTTDTNLAYDFLIPQVNKSGQSF